MQFMITHNNTLVLKPAEVLKALNMGKTRGYATLKVWKDEKILTPIQLPYVKGDRYNREEVEKLAKSKSKIKEN